jgi:hypothetical protein
VKRHNFTQLRFELNISFSHFPFWGVGYMGKLVPVLNKSLNLVLLEYPSYN